MKSYHRFVRSLKKIPERKQYIEFFTAILTIPVLLTVIIINVNNLRANDKKDTEQKGSPQIIVSLPPDKDDSDEKTPTNEVCKKEIGPVSISNPGEGDVVTDNPVQVTISYRRGDYCAVVWSYRINGGRWSDYDDNSVALYNLPRGNVLFELRVKSVVTAEEKVLKRNFVYQGSTTSTASESAH